MKQIISSNCSCGKSPMNGAHSEGDKAGPVSARGATSFAAALETASCTPLTFCGFLYSHNCCVVLVTGTSLPDRRGSAFPVNSLISRSNSGASSSRLLSRKGSSPFLLIWCRMMFSSRASLSFCWPFDVSGLRQLLQTFASVVFRSELAVGMGLDVDLSLDLRLTAVRAKLERMSSTPAWELTNL